MSRLVPDPLTLTIQEFLQKYYVHQLLSPADLTRICLTYLNFDIFKHSKFSNSGDIKAFNEAHFLARYATEYWSVFTSGERELDRDSHFDREVIQLMQKMEIIPENSV